MALFVVLTLTGCSQWVVHVAGQFEIEESVDDMDSFQSSAVAALSALGWELRRNDLLVDNERHRLFQDWHRMRGSWFWSEYDSLNFWADNEVGVITVTVSFPQISNLRNISPSYREQTLERMLDDYYLIRDEVFPAILGRSPSQLLIRTRGHPARALPVELLADFDREPLDAASERRLAQWNAGLIAGTREYQRSELREFLSQLSLWYGLPALLGTIVLALVWRYFVPHWELGIRGKRALFVALGFLIYAPVMLPMMGVTTYAASFVFPGPVAFFELIIVSILTGMITLQLLVIVLLWLVSRWLIKSAVPATR